MEIKLIFKTGENRILRPIDEYFGEKKESVKNKIEDFAHNVGPLYSATLFSNNAVESLLIRTANRPEEKFIIDPKTIKNGKKKRMMMLKDHRANLENPQFTYSAKNGVIREFKIEKLSRKQRRKGIINLVANVKQ